MVEHTQNTSIHHYINTSIQKEELMTRNNEIRQERAIPVQGRVDLVELADLMIYFKDKDIHVPSMSSLLAFAVHTAHWALASTGQLEIVHDTMAQAHDTMMRHGLYQKSMLKRTIKKINTAMSFENLRAEGVDPKHYVPQQFSMLHKGSSVDPIATDDSIVGGESKITQAIRNYRKMRNEEEAEASRLSRGLTDEDLKSLMRDPNAKPAKLSSPIDPRSIRPKISPKVPVTSAPCECELTTESDESSDKNSQPRALNEEELEARERAIAERDRKLSGDW